MNAVLAAATHSIVQSHIIDGVFNVATGLFKSFCPLFVYTLMAATVVNSEPLALPRQANSPLAMPKRGDLSSCTCNSGVTLLVEKLHRIIDDGQKEIQRVSFLGLAPSARVVSLISCRHCPQVQAGKTQQRLELDKMIVEYQNKLDLEGKLREQQEKQISELKQECEKYRRQLELQRPLLPLHTGAETKYRNNVTPVHGPSSPLASLTPLALSSALFPGTPSTLPSASSTALTLPTQTALLLATPPPPAALILFPPPPNTLYGYCSECAGAVPVRVTRRCNRCYSVDITTQSPSDNSPSEDWSKLNHQYTGCVHTKAIRCENKRWEFVGKSVV